MSFKLVGLPQRVAIHGTREFRGSVVCSDFLVLGLWEGACQCFLLCFFVAVLLVVFFLQNCIKYDSLS